mmetsp:Transcript_22189/g.56375  ORF Transcript_22189/g.56375 Transcript_22189/m.56375 type:complete len:220 (-) Transcript_22189:503-1162(-)
MPSAMSPTNLAMPMPTAVRDRYSGILMSSECSSTTSAAGCSPPKGQGTARQHQLELKGCVRTSELLRGAAGWWSRPRVTAYRSALGSTDAPGAVGRGDSATLPPARCATHTLRAITYSRSVRKWKGKRRTQRTTASLAPAQSLPSTISALTSMPSHACLAASSSRNSMSSRGVMPGVTVTVLYSVSLLPGSGRLKAEYLYMPCTSLVIMLFQPPSSPDS